MPQLLQRTQVVGGRHFAGQQWRQLQVAHASRQRLGPLPQQRPAGRPQQQKSPRPPVRINLGSQVGEQVGQHLHLVHHHQPVAVLCQEEFGLGQLRSVGRALQVEEQSVGVLRGSGLG